MYKNVTKHGKQHGKENHQHVLVKQTLKKQFFLDRKWAYDPDWRKYHPRIVDGLRLCSIFGTRCSIFGIKYHPRIVDGLRLGDLGLRSMAFKAFERLHGV